MLLRMCRCSHGLFFSACMWALKSGEESDGIKHSSHVNAWPSSFIQAVTTRPLHTGWPCTSMRCPLISRGRKCANRCAGHRYVDMSPTTARGHTGHASCGTGRKAGCGFPVLPPLSAACSQSILLSVSAHGPNPSLCLPTLKCSTLLRSVDRDPYCPAWPHRAF